MKHIIALLAAALLALTGCSSTSAAYQRVSAEEAKELMDTQKDYILLDVRTPEEFAQAHIPGAICIPNETIGTQPIDQLPSKEQMILIYCRSGNRSKQAADKLAKLGYANLVEFGGIQDWPYETVSELH